MNIRLQKNRDTMLLAELKGDGYTYDPPPGKPTADQVATEKDTAVDTSSPSWEDPRPQKRARWWAIITALVVAGVLFLAIKNRWIKI